ncbi:MAG: amylo-alpha-1,6-glucosidase [Candidatus Thermoplasmatota archaeon]
MKEWIVTNGLGGYASQTLNNRLSRKYHGLLIASLNPPSNRWVFIPTMREILKINDKTYDLSDQPSTFSFNLLPCFTYEIGDIHIDKIIFMPYHRNTTIIYYKVKTNIPITMIYHPYVNPRYFYDVTKRRNITIFQEITEDEVHVTPTNIDKTIRIILDDSLYHIDEYWDEFIYEIDKRRNDLYIDHAIHTGELHKNIERNCEFFMVLTIENEDYNQPYKLYLEEKNRLAGLISQTPLVHKDFERLVISSDRFIVKRNSRKTVIAGYPWFSDWGRDTLIALPGLTLVTRRYNDAKDILTVFSDHCENGLIPNVFIDQNSKPVYNTVDASLWYVDRVYQYLKYTNDLDLLEKVWPTLISIIQAYKNGTLYDIHMDEDYLISHGPGLTWMDVKIGDYYPTPRAKKAVEIQALWYNALCIMSKLTRVLSHNDTYNDLAAKVKESFIERYTDLYDVLDTMDASLRPNMILLVSLDHNMIDKKTQEHIVRAVQDKLLTIFGLRTLSPDNHAYRGSYLGNNKELAYHNGTVWPWLLGSFIKAYVKTQDYTESARAYAYTTFLEPMLNVFGENWDGSIPEIFDGDPPFTPQGCITQAWSVGEILRSLIEDVENTKPEYESFYLHKISV